ncbi:MAG TPA: Asp-tRNA(Asn)/Glu-tRNA(Gln) amidotransferase GatCAB subunit B, partial [Candidatus Paceibacterota bacterium]|nr:Asp-tRNA(Asn)/Glu-tRNA(Gln) amidotransferase GatCAB subunit B [Candidatus Paceibacterota bacterium]
EGHLPHAEGALLQLGTKVEVKNLNSFRSVERAISYEMKRQAKLLDGGGEVAQETRGWDEVRQETFSQRKKESSHDYRYFPDPDLPKLKLSELPDFSAEALKQALPELPWKKRERYAAEGISPEHAEMFVSDTRFGALFEAVAAAAPEAKSAAANFIGSDIAGLVAKHGEEGLARMAPAELASVLGKFGKGELSSRGAKDAIAEVFLNGGSLEEASKKYAQQSDAGALEAVARKVAEAYPQVASDYKAGKTASLQFLIGQGMKETKGAGNPGVLREAFIRILG